MTSDNVQDEIFHVPQAQQYCKGNFKSWDPMITTPPGLYALSLYQFFFSLWWFFIHYLILVSMLQNGIIFFRALLQHFYLNAVGWFVE